MLIETEEHAKARGAPILARVMGAAMTSDGYDPVEPDPSGQARRRRDRRARSNWPGLTPTDIDHINAHATGTTLGDLAEARAIGHALGRPHACGVCAQGGAGTFVGRGRSGGGRADGAGAARRRRAAHPQPERPRSRDRPGRRQPAVLAAPITATPSAIPLASAATTSRWSSAPH